MGRWRFFTDEESVGLTDDLCTKRDRARELFGAPIVQTCGYRSPEDNTACGGASHSAHLTGQAFDMERPASEEMRAKLMWALGVAGFKRVEWSDRHFHADCCDDQLHASPLWWIGPTYP